MVTHKSYASLHNILNSGISFPFVIKRILFKELNKHELVRLKLHLRHKTSYAQLFYQTEDVQLSFELVCGLIEKFMGTRWFASAAAAQSRVEQLELKLLPK